MRAEELLAEGWVSPPLRLERKEGGKPVEPMRRQLPARALYNSVSQGLSHATRQFLLLLGEPHWTIGYPLKNTPKNAVRKIARTKFSP